MLGSTVRGVRGVLLGLAALLAGAAAAHAESYVVAAVGGPGSYAFDLSCPPGELLVGVAPYWSNIGEPLQNLHGYCKSPAVDQGGSGREIGTSSPINPSSSVFCPQGSFVSGIKVGVQPPPARARVVSIFCRKVGAGYVGKVAFVEMLQPTGIQWENQLPVRCRDNDLARGLQGARDVYVNSVGLLCDVIPGPGTITPKEQAQTQPCAFCKEEVIANPSINDVALDVCLNWGTGCGKPAADAFCQQRGFNYSSAQTTQPNAPPTYVLGDNRVCNESFCARFTSITCNR